MRVRKLQQRREKGREQVRRGRPAGAAHRREDGEGGARRRQLGARVRGTEDEAGREGEGARGLLELQVNGEEAGDADDGVEARLLGADPVVGGRDLAGSRASRRSRRRGGVAWRGVGAALARAAMARRGRGARALQHGELLSLAMCVVCGGAREGGVINGSWGSGAGCG